MKEIITRWFYIHALFSYEVFPYQGFSLNREVFAEDTVFPLTQTNSNKQQHTNKQQQTATNNTHRKTVRQKTGLVNRLIPQSCLPFEGARMK
jgi:hypothetical protein